MSLTSGGWRAVRQGQPSTPGCSDPSAGSRPARSLQQNCPTPRCIRTTPAAAADWQSCSPGNLGYTVVPGGCCPAAVRTPQGQAGQPGSDWPVVVESAADWPLAGRGSEG